MKPGKTVEFNPRSHDHIAERLIAQRGWQPEEYTETGKPQTDGDILEVLGKQWPECATLARHGEIQKIIGMVAEGKTAYLKVVKNGRIYGRVVTNGAVTGRCSHKEPNLGNIPRRSPLGKRVRQLFVSIPGFRLVGSDAKGLEIRMLAHFLAKFDGGAYAKIAVESDPHVYHQGLAGLPTKDNAKTFFYGWLYGAGDTKIGLIIGKGAAAGKTLRLMFLKKFPALNALKNAVSAVAKQRGYLVGLDGRRLRVRAVYSSLNTLLQAAGAIVVKQWTVLFNREIRAKGLFQAGHVRQVVHVHDEFQLLVREGYEEQVMEIAKRTMTEAGQHFNLRCRTDGDSKAGTDWGQTH
jgi:DNA polymerase I-like protein with 3'-5' exonuclease and polymerase domains